MPAARQASGPDQKSILAFIGARAGSKGIAHKNIIDFMGQPLISWTIQAALKSANVERVLVSTDGPEIAAIARHWGADVPFLRPPELASDTATMLEALNHGLDWLRAHEGRSYDYILLLQPTSPLRVAHHIDQAIDYYFANCRSELDTLVSVSRAPSKCGWLMRQNAAGYLNFCFDLEQKGPQRQALPEFYLPNGMIYFAPAAALSGSGFYQDHTLAFVTPDEISVDIDSPEDLQMAKDLFRSRA